MEATDEWVSDFISDEQEMFKLEELKECDALLIGRRTYERFADSWLEVVDTTGYANMMNEYPKNVVTSTLKEAKWNNTMIIDGNNILGEISELKQLPGKDILVLEVQNLYII